MKSNYVKKVSNNKISNNKTYLHETFVYWTYEFVYIFFEPKKYSPISRFRIYLCTKDDFTYILIIKHIKYTYVFNHDVYII